MPHCVSVVIGLAGPLVFWCFIGVDQEETGVKGMNYCSKFGDALSGL